MKRILLVIIFGTISMAACGGSSSTPTSATPTPPPGGGGGGGSTGGSTTSGGCDTAGIIWGGGTGTASGTASGFVEVGPMLVARAGHTATLLPNKTVLLIDGGQMDINALLVSISSAEIFDPSRGTFTATGSPCIAREFHTATLLGNGKVLVAGGNEFNGYPTFLTPTSTAELYDPASGSFTATGSMAVGRSGHTASLLADGRVLIVGGSPEGAPTAEIYNPNTGIFSVVPGIIEERFGHTATVLSSGKVLIAGGQASQADGSPALATAEVYDPQANSFTPVSAMNSPRAGHTATPLPDGKVLIAGGSSGGGSGQGFLSGSHILQTTELYDPTTGTFAAAASMSTTRIGHTATLLADGKVMICGGFKNWTGYDSAEIFDPATDSFTVAGQMNVGRFWHSATLLPNGSVLVAGGIGDATVDLSSAEIF